MYKKLVALLSALVMIMSVTSANATSYAAVIPPDSPAYSYTNDCNVALSISGRKATCKSTLNGYYNTTTSIEITHTLQKKNSDNEWDDVDTWSTTINNFSGSLTSTKSSLSNGTYRVKTVFTVYSGTAHETITKYSKNKTI